MLNKDRGYFGMAYMLILACLMGCDLSSNNQKSKDEQIYERSLEVLGKENYNELKSLIQDSLNSWATNRLGNWTIDDSTYVYQLDSLFCINTTKTKLISAILTQYKIPDNLCGGLLFFYGAKIDGDWYFWTGASVFIPKDMNMNIKKGKPISFSQLHEQALKEVLGGYLTKDGKINEAWFEFHFEKDGWVQFEEQGKKYDYFLKGKRYANKKKFLEVMYLYRANKIWADKAYQDSLKNLKVNK